MVGPPLRRFELSCVTINEESSSVDNYIDIAKLCDRLPKNGLHVILSGDVTRSDQSVTFEFRSYGFELLLVAADEHDTFGSNSSPGLRDSLSMR